ncbi:MAG: cyclic peptide export ABC transporter [Alphaproteobacteria bacterium]|nr:cyclic peptide export ABC transporter [Alphaproteobacteria bacterium]
MSSDSSPLFAELLRILRPFWPIALLSTVMGAASGLATAGLLAVINHALHADGAIAPAVLLTFAGLGAVALVGETVSNIANSLGGQRIVAALRRELCGKILMAPIARIEAWRAHRLIAALNQDVDTISAFSFNFPAMAIAAAVTFGCFVYLAILSPTLLLLVAVAIAAGAGVQVLARRAGVRGFTQAREAQDELQRLYGAITQGAKELRIDRRRRARVWTAQLGGTIDRIRRLNVRATIAFRAAGTAGVALFLVVVAMILALHDRLGLDKTVVSGFVLTLLFVKGPIEQLLGSLPMIGQAHVSFRKLAELSGAFAHSEPHLLVGVDETGRFADTATGMIALRNVCYAYPASAGGEVFALGPIDLTVQPGEMLFITGENGSGKTTLIKLLLGLYEPSGGEILHDGVPVTAATRDDYRQMFSAIFFDYFLFQDIVAPGPLAADAAASYLQRLDLAGKVTIDGGAFSTIDLSAGQRKRLALIQVYLARRPVIVFDEWAAEQDPTFRRIFYSELLPELKRDGKTLIVVSHDDRYFGVADRRIRLEGGRLVEDIRSR